MATEYAQCPDCLDEGPHQVHGNDLVCAECGTTFENPFIEPTPI